MSEAERCLRDIENALRLGNSEGVHRGVFIWSQRRDRILDGQESWEDQRFDPAERRTSGRYFTDADLRARDERIIRAALHRALSVGSAIPNVITANPPARRSHPYEKPTELWAHFTQRQTPRVVVEPFMGSGAGISAALAHGHHYIGIEIEERYCEIAAKRLAQEVLPL